MPDTSSGAIFEDLVYNDLVAKGFVESNTRLASNYNKILIKHIPYKTIYGHKGKTEFLIIDSDRSIRIECKHQDVAGSKIEALPYLYLNAVECFPEDEIILLFSGKFYEAPKPDNYSVKRQSQWGCTDWLRNACDSGLYLPEGSKKIIKFMFYPEFKNWLNSGIPYLTR